MTAVITIAALVFLYAPLAVVVLFSFHSTGSLAFPFEGFSLRWYREVFDSEEFRHALSNSLVVAPWPRAWSRWCWARWPRTA